MKTSMPFSATFELGFNAPRRFGHQLPIANAWKVFSTRWRTGRLKSTEGCFSCLDLETGCFPQLGSCCLWFLFGVIWWKLVATCYNTVLVLPFRKLFWSIHAHHAHVKGIGGPGAPHAFQLKRFCEVGTLLVDTITGFCLSFRAGCCK